MDAEKIKKCAELISNSKYLVAFTGAGVSTESGVPDFRSKGGVFELLKKKYKRSPEEILSIDFFLRNTKDFFDIHRSVFLAERALPNDCHKSFAELEKRGIMKCVVTQNIDNLHQDGGSKTVYELHGNMFRNICSSCRKEFSLEYLGTQGVPYCDDCSDVVRPDIVFYGEGLDQNVIENSVDNIRRADTLIVAGTSLQVYPAAGFISYFSGENLILINRDETPYDSSASLIIRDPVAKVMKDIINLL